MNKFATYLILGVVAVLTLATMISALAMAFQALVYAAAACAVIWFIHTVATYFNKPKDNKPPE